MLQENSKGKYKYFLLMILFVSCNLKKTDNIVIEPFYVINRIDSSIHASFSIEPAYIYKGDNFLIHDFIRGEQTKAYIDSFVEKIREKNFPPSYVTHSYTFYEYSSTTNNEYIKLNPKDLNTDDIVYDYRFNKNGLLTFIEYKNGHIVNE
ncbi:MAG: hypothetical protein ACOYLT_11895 [Flavobacterium sp.]|uniref:hypothetical protein n=1 Tax=Flavobacterium sp. TaxID=239 RepID=UPI003BE7716C